MAVYIEFDSFLSRRWPWLYKLLFRCYPDELVATRKACSFILGVLVGYLMLALVANRTAFALNEQPHLDRSEGIMQSGHRLAFVAMFATFYANSVRFRAIVCIVFPTINLGWTKVTLIMVMLWKTASISIHEFTTNLNVLFEWNFCFFKNRE